jgi:polyhydroxybutyrate depolymerase
MKASADIQRILVCALCLQACSSATSPSPASDRGAAVQTSGASGFAAIGGSSATASPAATTRGPLPAASGTGGHAAANSGVTPPAPVTMSNPVTQQPTAASNAGAPASAVPPGQTTPSSGCGSMNFPASADMMMDVSGTMREYIVKLPANYDPTKPYRLILAFHGLGGTAMQIAGGFGGGYYGLEQRAMGSAIFIAPQGLPVTDGAAGARATPPPTMAGASGAQAQVAAIAAAGGPGWPNTNGRDVAFIKQLVDWANTNYCVDRARIFSVGMSYGGIMSNTLGCQMGDVFRAIAPMSGSGPLTFGKSQCVGQVAAWMSHGNMDDVVPFSSGQMSRDHWVMNNHCQQTTMPEGSNGCVAYQGCDPGYPVVWCEFSGGHTVPAFSGDEIWTFLSQF